MAEVVRVKLNPELLVWARTSAGYSVGDIAKFFDKSEDKISAWELGSEMPTIHQLEKLANKVKRPLAAFFLPKPPDEPPLPQDYRVLSGKPSGEFEPDTLICIREARTALSELAELVEALGSDRLVLSLPTVRLDDNPEEKAVDFRSRLGITVPVGPGFPNPGPGSPGLQPAKPRLREAVFFLAPADQVPSVSRLGTSLLCATAPYWRKQPLARRSSYSPTAQ